MKVNNKDLIQPYILTAARYDYSVYEKRILYRIIEMLQKYTKGLKLNNKYKIEKNLFGDLDVVMPMSAFLKDENDNNYQQAKKALLSLNLRVIQYEDDAEWEAFNLIERPKIKKFDSVVSLRISPEIGKAFLDFSKGYSKYELETAMSFDSVYAMRFYELLSGQKQPISYTIDHLKIMFQIQNKYKLTTDFIKNVIDIAKKELDEKSPYSFEYKTNKLGRKINSVTFYPVYQSKNRDPEIEARKLLKNTSLRFDINHMVVNYLKENYVFSDEEIKNNRQVFIDADKCIDLLYFLSQQKRQAESKKNPKGWIIGVLKKQIDQNVVKSLKVAKNDLKSENKAISDLASALSSK